MYYSCKRKRPLVERKCIFFSIILISRMGSLFLSSALGKSSPENSGQADVNHSF